MCEQDNTNSTRSSQEEKGEVGKKLKKLEAENRRLKKKMESQGKAYEESQELDGSFGWKLPGIEAYSIRYWAAMFNMDIETLCKKVSQLKIPHIGFEIKNSYIETENITTLLLKTPG